MSRTYIPKSLRQRVLAEARGLCAYCQTAVSITGARFVIDHIVPEYAGGQTVWENLCLACHSCNEFKGILMEATDPITAQNVPLFHPKQQQWAEHFSWGDGNSLVVGLTTTGRATAVALNMNHPDLVSARLRWVAVGWHPPQMD